jgi:hypothetical protein
MTIAGKGFFSLDLTQIRLDNWETGAALEDARAVHGETGVGIGYIPD